MRGKCSQVLPDMHCSSPSKYCCSTQAYIKHHRGQSRVIYEVLKSGSYSPPADTSPIIQVYWLKRSFPDPHKWSHPMLPVKYCMCFLSYRVLLVLPCVRLFKIRWHRHDLSSGLGVWLGLSIQKVSIPPSPSALCPSQWDSRSALYLGPEGRDGMCGGAVPQAARAALWKNPHVPPKEQLCT